MLSQQLSKSHSRFMLWLSTIVSLLNLASASSDLCTDHRTIVNIATVYLFIYCVAIHLCMLYYIQGVQFRSDINDVTRAHTHTHKSSKMETKCTNVYLHQIVDDQAKCAVPTACIIQFCQSLHNNGRYRQ